MKERVTADVKTSIFSQKLINFPFPSTFSYRKTSDTSCTVHSDHSTFHPVSWFLYTFEFIMQLKLAPEEVLESNRESLQMIR